MARPVPIQFGHDWLERDGRRGALRWWPTNGHLIYEPPAGPAELIACIPDEPIVRVRLIDWEDHMTEGVDWARRRVEAWT